MGCEDEAHGAWRHLGEARQNLLVGRPCAAAYEDAVFVVAEPLLDHLVALGSLGNLMYTVEARVAGQRTLLDAVVLEQTEALFVLHEEVGEILLELFPEPSAIPLEEILPGTENGGEDVGLRTPSLQCFEVVVPEFVFDEEDRVGIDVEDETSHVARRVHGQVADGVGQCVVLSYLVARGREEGHQHLMVGMASAILFEHGPGLLKLTQAGSVEPHGGAVVTQLGHLLRPAFPSVDHQPRLLVSKQRHHTDSQRVEPNSNSIYQTHNF